MYDVYIVRHLYRNIHTLHQKPDENKERSSALKQFDEMQSRIAQVVQGAEKNLKSHSGVSSTPLPGDAWATDKAGPLVSSAVLEENNPFIQAPAASGSTTAWQGFDDDFSTPNEVAATSKSTTGVPTIIAECSLLEPSCLDSVAVVVDGGSLGGSNDGLDLLGGVGGACRSGVAGAAVSSYSLVALGGGGGGGVGGDDLGGVIVAEAADNISPGINSPPANYDSLIPFTGGAGVASSVSKDDVFGLTLDPLATSTAVTSGKLGSQVDLFSFADGPSSSASAEMTAGASRCLDNLATADHCPLSSEFLSKIPDNDEEDEDDPFIVRTAQEVRNDTDIKDAIDSAFGDPFEV